MHFILNKYMPQYKIKKFLNKEKSQFKVLAIYCASPCNNWIWFDPLFYLFEIWFELTRASHFSIDWRRVNSQTKIKTGNPVAEWSKTGRNLQPAILLPVLGFWNRQFSCRLVALKPATLLPVWIDLEFCIDC